MYVRLDWYFGLFTVLNIYFFNQYSIMVVFLYLDSVNAAYCISIIYSFISTGYCVISILILTCVSHSHTQVIFGYDNWCPLYLFSITDTSNRPLSTCLQIKSRYLSKIGTQFEMASVAIQWIKRNVCHKSLVTR